MKKLTKNEKIENLENEVARYQKLLNEAWETIYDMQEKADIAFTNSMYCKQLKDKIDTLERLHRNDKKTRTMFYEKLRSKDRTIKQLMQENEK